MIRSWYILAIINVVSISVGALFQKLSMKKNESDPVASSVIFQFLLGFITLVYAYLNGFRLPPVQLLPYFVTSGVLYALGTIAYFKAYKFIGASEVTVLGGAGVITTIIASFLFLHDTLTLRQIIGVILIISAVIVVNITRKKFTVNAGTWLALLGTSAYGLAVVSDSYIVRQYHAISYLPLISFLPGIFIFLAFIRRARSICREVMRVDRNLVIFILLYAVQAITFYAALGVGALVSEISIISRTAIILTVILAMIFLKETKDVLRKILAAVLTTLGVLLVTT